MSVSILNPVYASPEDKQKELEELAKQDAKRIGSDKIISGIIEKEAGKQAGFPETSASFIIQEIDRNHTNDRQFFQLSISMDELKESDGIAFRYYPDRTKTFEVFKTEYLPKWDRDKRERYIAFFPNRGGAKNKDEFNSLENELVKEYQKTSVPIKYFRKNAKGGEDAIPYSDVLEAARELSDRLLADPKRKQTLRRRLAEKARGYQNLNERLVLQATCPEKNCGLNHMNDPEFQSMGFSMEEIQKRFHHIFFKTEENDRGEITRYSYGLGDDNQIQHPLFYVQDVKKKIAILYGNTTLQELYYQQVGSPARGLPLIKSVSLVKQNPWCHVTDPNFYKYCVSMQEIYDAVGYTFLIDWQGETLDSNIYYFDRDGHSIGKSEIINAAYLIAIRRAINPVKNPNIPKTVDCFIGDSNKKCTGSEPVYITDYLPNFISDKDMHISMSEMERYGYKFDVGLHFNFKSYIGKPLETVWRAAKAAVTRDWDALKNAPIVYSRMVIPYRLNHVKGQTDESQDKDWIGRYYVSSEVLPELPQIDVTARNRSHITTRLENIKKLLEEAKKKSDIDLLHNILLWLSFDNGRYKGIYSISQTACDHLCKYTNLMLAVFEGAFCNEEGFIQKPDNYPKEAINTWLDEILTHVGNAILNPVLVEGDSWANASKIFSSFFLKFVKADQVKLSLFHGIVNISDSSFWQEIKKITIYETGSYDQRIPSTISLEKIIGVKKGRMNSVLYDKVEYEIPRMTDGQIPPKGYHIVDQGNIVIAAKLIEIANEIQAKPLNQVAKSVLGRDVTPPSIEKPEKNHTKSSRVGEKEEPRNSLILRLRDGSSHFPKLGEKDYPKILGLYFRLAYFSENAPISRLEYILTGKEQTENIITYMLIIEKSKGQYDHIPIPYSEDDMTELGKMVGMLDKDEEIPNELKKKFVITLDEMKGYKTYSTDYKTIIPTLTVESLLEKMKDEITKLQEMIGNQAGKDAELRLQALTITFAKSLSYKIPAIIAGKIILPFEKGDEKVPYVEMEKRFLRSYFGDDLESQRERFTRTEDKKGSSTKFLENFNAWILGNKFTIKTESGRVDTEITIVPEQKLIPPSVKPQTIFKYYRYTGDKSSPNWCFLTPIKKNQNEYPPRYKINRTNNQDRINISPQELGMLREEFKERLHYKKSVEDYNKNHSDEDKHVKWMEDEHKLVMKKGEGEPTEEVRKAFMCIHLPSNTLSIIRGSAASSSRPSGASQPLSQPPLPVISDPKNFLVNSYGSDLEILKKVEPFYSKQKVNNLSFTQFETRYKQAKEEGRLKPLTKFNGNQVKTIEESVNKINKIFASQKNDLKIDQNNFPWNTSFGYFLIAIFLGNVSNVFYPEPMILEEGSEQSGGFDLPPGDLLEFDNWLKTKGKKFESISGENLRQAHTFWTRTTQDIPQNKLAINNLISNLASIRNNPIQFKTKCSEIEQKLKDFSEKYGDENTEELKLNYERQKKIVVNVNAAGSTSGQNVSSVRQQPAPTASSSSSSSSSSGVNVTQPLPPLKKCETCDNQIPSENPLHKFCKECRQQQDKSRLTTTEPSSQPDNAPSFEEVVSDDIYEQIQRKIRTRERFNESDETNKAYATLVKNIKDRLSGEDIHNILKDWNVDNLRYLKDYVDME